MRHNITCSGAVHGILDRVETACTWLGTHFLKVQEVFWAEKSNIPTSQNLKNKNVGPTQQTSQFLVCKY